MSELREASPRELRILAEGVWAGSFYERGLMKATTHWPYSLNEVTAAYVIATNCIMDCLLCPEKFNLTRMTTYPKNPPEC